MMDIDINFDNKRNPEKLDSIRTMSTKKNVVKPLIKLKNRTIHSSAALYGSDKNDFVFAVFENVYYVNFPLHSKFINQLSQLQTTEQSLPAWLAD